MMVRGFIFLGRLPSSSAAAIAASGSSAMFEMTARKEKKMLENLLTHGDEAF
jgi:hypothetical protein